MDSGFLVGASSGVLGKEGWALAVGGGRVRDTGSKGSGTTWREGIENMVEDPPGERDGGDSLLGSTGSGVDQEHRTACSASKHARSSYKPAIFVGIGFSADASSGVLGGEDCGPLRLEAIGSGVQEVTIAVCGGRGWRR